MVKQWHFLVGLVFVEVIYLTIFYVISNDLFCPVITRDVDGE